MSAPVLYSPALIVNCKQLLKLYGIQGVVDQVHGVEKQQKKRYSPIVTAFVELAQDGTTRSVQDEKGLPYHLHPFLTAPNNPDVPLVWLGFRMRFDPMDRGGFQLVHMQVVLHRGVQTLRPLLRAEWDPRDGDAEHSQPHWHVHSAGSGDDPVDERWGRFTQKLHLAMCAQWHRSAEGSTSRHSLVMGCTEDAGDWLGHVLAYLQSQLTYALTKVPIEEPDDSLSSGLPFGKPAIA